MMIESLGLRLRLMLMLTVAEFADGFEFVDVVAGWDRYEIGSNSMLLWQDRRCY